MERKLLDMMNQLSISEHNPRLEYCDKFQICRIKKICIMKEEFAYGTDSKSNGIRIIF